MRELTETDMHILKTARKMFIDQGIVKTQMKDLAKKLGCSRSTLYRHFPSKGDILFLLARQALELIEKAVQIPDSLKFSCGYDALLWQMNALVETLIFHIDDVIFLRDFDSYFS